MSYKQTTLFETVNGNVVVNNFKPSPGESKTTPATVKLTFSEKEQLQEFCFKNDLSVSEYMRNASRLYHAYFPYIAKLEKYRSAVISMLEKLP